MNTIDYIALQISVFLCVICGSLQCNVFNCIHLATSDVSNAYHELELIPFMTEHYGGRMESAAPPPPPQF